MNRFAIIASSLILLVILLIGGWYIANINNTANQTSLGTPTPVATSSSRAASLTEETASNPATIVQQTKEFTVNGGSYFFQPTEIRVSKGDRVRITYKNSDSTHNFTIDGYDVKTKLLAGNAEETVEFTADKAGTFEFYCSVGNHRQMGMRGNLIVE
jgi:plastocyanin